MGVAFINIIVLLLQSNNKVQINMKKVLIFSTIIFSTFMLAQSQNVAINTTGAVGDASSMLDVSSTTTGILVPRITLSATNVAAPVTAPLNSLLVYNTATAGAGTTAVTPGYYYWDNPASLWRRMMPSVEGWGTLGNYNTVAGTNFAGTVDNVTFDIRTNNTLRARIWNTGEMVVNNAGGFAGDVFSAYGTGTNNSINGYLSGVGAGVAGYFESTSSAAANATISVNNSANNQSGVADFYVVAGGVGWNVYVNSVATSVRPAVAATTLNLTNTAVAGSVNGTGTINTLVGGSGGAFTAPTTGVYATASTVGSGVGGLFAGNGLAVTTPGAGGAGSSSTGADIGVFGTAATVATGTGGVFAGNNSGYSTLAGGSGVAGTGVTTGVFGTANSGGAGTGGVFGGNNLTTTTLAGGSGVAGTGASVGVAGFIQNNAAGSMGGYFQRNGGTFIARVCENNGGTDQKIRGTGAVATVIKDLQGNEVTMFCPESPEVLFQDFGQSQLVNGHATISLDPIFTSNVTINEKHPLRVIIQLEGDCNGVFVTNKTSTGFEVKELNGGSSNVAFTYFVTANRADRIEDGVLLSKFEDVRFLKGDALQLNTIENETNTQQSIILENKSTIKEGVDAKKNTLKID